MTPAQSLIECRSGGRVERCHTIPHSGSYSNSSHSWGVAVIMRHIWPDDFGRLCAICLFHDTPERIVGDIPSPTINKIPGLKESLKSVETKINSFLGLPTEQDLSEEDHSKLKACDHLELYFWAHEQLLIGNSFARELIDGLEAYWEKSPLPEKAERLRLNVLDVGFVPTDKSKFLQIMV